MCTYNTYPDNVLIKPKCSIFLGKFNTTVYHI